jgi:hypothetical protein
MCARAIAFRQRLDAGLPAEEMYVTRCLREVHTTTGSSRWRSESAYRCEVIFYRLCCPHHVRSTCEPVSASSEGSELDFTAL